MHAIDVAMVNIN